MTSKIHHYASNVIRHTKSLSWVLRLKELYAAQILHQAICKLRGEEARRDGVGRNMLWSQLDGELPAQMGCRCFARGVHDCSCHSVNSRPYLEDCENLPFTPVCGTVLPAVELTMIILAGSSFFAAFSSIGWNTCTMLNIPLTFRSNTLALLQSGVVSNGPPQVAPALATRMSMWSVCCFTFSMNFTSSSRFPASHGIPIAFPLIPGRAFSFVTA